MELGDLRSAVPPSGVVEPSTEPPSKPMTKPSETKCSPLRSHIVSQSGAPISPKENSKKSSGSSKETISKPGNSDRSYHASKPLAAVRPNNSNPTSPLELNSSSEIPESEGTVLDQNSHVFDQNMSGFSDLVPFDGNYSFDLDVASEVVLETSSTMLLPHLESNTEESSHQVQPSIDQSSHQMDLSVNQSNHQMEPAVDQTIGTISGPIEPSNRTSCCLNKQLEPTVDQSNNPIDSLEERNTLENTSASDSSSESEGSSEHEESLLVADSNGRADNRTSRKPKRPNVEICLICKKALKKMRDHLNNSHKLQNNPRIKRFIGTYYSTLSTKKCYQCLVCLKRMGFKQTHPKHHKPDRIFDRQNVKLFPVEVQLALRNFSEASATHFQEIVHQFDQHLQGLVDDGDIVSVNTLSSTLKKFLGDVVVKTKQFSETVELANCVRDFMDDYSLKKITMNNYLGKLKKFFTFLELHAGDLFPNFKLHPWDKVLDEVRARYHVGASRERRLKTKELHEKVPSLVQVQEINCLVQNFLNKDLNERVLNYKELCTLNFLILSFRLNCRAGPLLHLTWDDVESIKKHGQLETDRHKTGRFYDVTIRIQPDQMKWLKRLKSRFVKEFKTAPTLVVSSSVNKVEQSMARNIRTLLSQLFEDKTGNKDFHATAVRKMWDTHFHQNRRNFKESVFNSHLHQTGHTGETAMKDYVVPQDKSEVLNTYLQELDKLQKSSQDDDAEDFGVLSTLKDATPSGSKGSIATPRNCTPEIRTPIANRTNNTETSHSKPKLVTRVQPCELKSQRETEYTSDQGCFIFKMKFLKILFFYRILKS